MKALIFTLGGLLILFSIYLLPLTGEFPQEALDEARDVVEGKEGKEAAKALYDFVDERYTSPIRQYIREPQNVFIKDKTKIWEGEGQYMSSNVQNNFYKDLYIELGLGVEEDFEYVQSYCSISPHERWDLKIENKTFWIDLWVADHGGGFGCFAFPTCQPEDIVCFEEGF